MKPSMLCQEWLTSLSKPDGILQEIQKQSRDSIQKVGLPSKNDEDWRVTNFKRLQKILEIPIAKGKKIDLKPELNILKSTKNKVWQFTLSPELQEFSKMELPNGVELINEKELQIYLGNNIELFKCKEEWSTLINECSAGQVLGLKVTGKDLPTLEVLIPAESNCFNATRLLLVLEEEAKVEVVQVFLGSNFSAQSHLIEIELAERSNFQHTIIALGGGEASLSAQTIIKQEKLSNYSLNFLQSGWLWSRLEPRIVQINGEAETNIKGLQIARKNEQVSTHSFVRFNGPDGKLNQLNKALADDSGHSIFYGSIQVPKIAQQTQANQLSRNLLLSKRARIDAKPQLEIIADDVSCTHGATVSELQEEELFYLKSRGIDSNRANSLLLNGFYQEIISAFPMNWKRWLFSSDLFEVKNKE